VAQQTSEPAAALALHQDALFAHLAQGLLDQLPAPALRFMQLTAIPLRFTDDLAASLLAIEPAQVIALRQEVLRRNLFLDATKEDHWYRYHDLIRAFLITTLHQQGEEVTALYRRIVAWFEAREDLPQAIEHALAGELYTDAAQLISRLAFSFIAETGRYHTFRRWILNLPATVQAAHPLLLMQLGKALREVGGREQGWSYLHAAHRYAQLGGDRDTLVRVQLALAETHIVDGDAGAALAVCHTVLQEEQLKSSLRRRALKIAGGAHYLRSELAQTRRNLEAALALPEDAESPPDAHIRQNLIVTTLIPLGDFASAERYLRQNDAFFAGRLVERIWHLLTWSWYYEAIGDWENLAATLEEIRRLEAQTEQADESNTGEMVLRILLYIGRGAFAAAADLIKQMAAYPDINPEQSLYVSLCHAWLVRRQGDYRRVHSLVDEALAQPWDVPLYRAALALERAIAYEFQARYNARGGPSKNNGRIEDDDGALQVGEFLWLRARPWLVRLNALLALRCHRLDDPRWRRRIESVHRTLSHPGYLSLLTRRDPELGTCFWVLCLAEGIAIEQAHAALWQIGQMAPGAHFVIESVARLLDDQRPAVRLRSAGVLAALQHEEAIPLLAAALERAKDKAVAAAIEAALAGLESAPPPLLAITLMGDFAVQRGPRSIAPETWPRPAVRSLFQYFALHRGQPLMRDRILEDLWPDTDPEKARASFRTVFSWLRKVLEPYFRPKSPSRYFSVEGDVYTFDPQRNSSIANIDAEDFVVTVTSILHAGEDHVLPPLPDELLIALTKWQPLLPDALYEAWAIDMRERLQELYVQGCLYVAQALLAYGRPAEAAPWAEKAVNTAPWLEEAYQALIRAQARQGRRSLALNTYDATVAALKRELDVPPSTLTEWLVQRLRADEEI
jgi:DNA-binding SARP family transcriptional activator